MVEEFGDFDLGIVVLWNWIIFCGFKKFDLCFVVEKSWIVYCGLKKLNCDFWCVIDDFKYICIDFDI